MKYRPSLMPILRIDLFEPRDAGQLPYHEGARYFPANQNMLDELKMRWCGQCRLQDECGIIARVDMILALNDGDFTSIIGSALAEDQDLRPREWTIQRNNQPRCIEMQIIGM